MSGVCVVDGVAERLPCEVDEELGDCGMVVWGCREALKGVGM